MMFGSSHLVKTIPSRAFSRVDTGLGPALSSTVVGSKLPDPSPPLGDLLTTVSCLEVAGYGKRQMSES